MDKDTILQTAVEELRQLADNCGIDLTERTLGNLFIRKKAFQKDWPSKTARQKASMIAGTVLVVLGEEPSSADLQASLVPASSSAAV